MSATVYLLARTYPALFIIPALNIPIVNGVVIRIGTQIVENVCINLPMYLFRKAHHFFRGRKDVNLNEEDYLLVTFKEDPDFPGYDSIEIL